MDGAIDTWAKTAVTAVTHEDDDALHAMFSPDGEILQEDMWSFLTKVNELLQPVDMTPSLCSTYSTLLRLLAPHGKPKELIYAYLESCDAFQNSEIFCEIIPFLSKALDSVPEKQRSLEIVCDTLYSHVQSCNWHPHDYVLVEEDTDTPYNPKVNGEESEATQRLLRTVGTLVKEFFVPQCETCTLTTGRDALSQTLVNVCHYPLLYILDNTQMEPLVSSLTVLYPTLTKLIFPETIQDIYPFGIGEMVEFPLEQAKTSEDSSLPGLGNLLNVIMCHGYASTAMPSVYTHRYRFASSLSILNSLFRRASNSVVALKAIHLLEAMLKDVTNGELDQEFLDHQLLKGIITFICWSMQFCELLTTRQCSAKVLPLLLSKFNLVGKYRLFLLILNTESSAEILSYVFTLIKDFVHESWSDSDDEKARYSLALLELIFKVPDGEGGHLLSDLDKISSALNLARYLVKRDSSRRAVYTNKMTRYINEYIQPVGRCLRSQLTTLEDRVKTITNKKDELPEMSVDIGSETLVCNKDMEKEATLSAINKIHIVLHVHDCLLESLAL